MIPTGPIGGEKTNVVVLLTNTGNDQLVKFYVTLDTLTLTDKFGNEVTLYNSEIPNGQAGVAPGEFVHLNGVSEPLVTTAIPQATYTSAAATVDGCSFTNVTQLSGSLNIDEYGAGTGCGPGSSGTVTLSAPLVISGSAMVLSLNLQQSQSYTLTSPYPNPVVSFSPTFTLSPINLSPNPTSDQNGKLAGLDMQITSLGESGNTFTATIPDYVQLAIATDASTVFQGATDFSSLAVGTLVNADLAIQSDGSLKATRIEADDAASPTEWEGPFLAPTSPPQTFLTQIVQQQGCAGPPNLLCSGDFETTGTTAFKVSGRFTNLASLPFTPVLSSATLFAGQNLEAFTSGTFTGGNQPATTVVLIPQTINGTVASMANQNGFAVYTVTLAPYDLIPTLQGQVGVPVVTAPNSVTVYVDTTTQLLNSGDIAVGSLLRFNGVIFYDNGTLRMDCAQVNDGVTE
jgi:hypothetical protein